MKRSPGFRNTPSKLSDSVHHQLNMYSLAAAAAGVSLFALAEPSEAKIIYTPAHHVIGRNSTFGLDLNHGGKTDFTLGNRFRTATSGVLMSVYASAALKSGTSIPNRRRFSQAKARMEYRCSGAIGSCPPYSSVFSGNWFNVSNRYLGLKFKIDGKVHYGWARLSIQWNKSRFTFSVTLTGYAYETIANKAIIAGKTKGPDEASVEESVQSVPTRKPASLGLLALGSPALSIWRREVPAHEKN